VGYRSQSLGAGLGTGLAGSAHTGEDTPVDDRTERGVGRAAAGRSLAGAIGSGVSDLFGI